jgi:hypothetical protein
LILSGFDLVKKVRFRFTGIDFVEDFGFSGIHVDDIFKVRTSLEVIHDELS